MQGISLTHPMLPSFLRRGVSLTHSVLSSILCREFILHIPRCHNFYLGSFSYTSRAGFIFICGVSLTHTMLTSFVMRVVFFTHPVLSWFLCKEFLLLCKEFLLLCKEFLLHNPCWLNFFYTSRSGMSSDFIRGVSLTHPALASFSSGELLLHIPCWRHFYLENISHTSCAGFICIWGVSITHPELALIGSDSLAGWEQSSPVDEEEIKIKMDDGVARFFTCFGGNLFICWLSRTQNEIVELPCEGWLKYIDLTWL